MVEETADTATICVVDDDADVNQALSRSLTSHGYQVLSYPSAAQFLEEIKGKPLSFDLVVSDVSMPGGVSGYDLCSSIRKLQTDTHIPIILVTGSDPSTHKERGLDLGADDFIQKPFRLQEILAKVRSLLKIHGRQRELLEEQSGKTERLSRFFSPDLAAALAAGDADTVKPHRKNICVLFVDLRRFTPFAEAAEPEEVLRVLEGYYATVGNLAIKHGGTAGPFSGDGVMVFFNDPKPLPDYAQASVRMALEMRKELNAQKVEWDQAGHDLDFGIGIAEGFATIGIIGGVAKFHQYCVIGTVANTAARLCKEANQGQILVPQRLLTLLGDEFKTESAEQLQLKGLQKSMLVYNIAD